MTRPRHALLLAACALPLLLIPSVVAHGQVVTSSPEANARLASAPHRILINMSGPVELSGTHVQVYDINGTNYAQGEPRAATNDTHPTRIIVDVDLPGNGTYTVAYEALWTEDGHTTQGGFAFAVGNASLTNAFAAPTSSPYPPLDDAITKWVSLASWLLLSGLCLVPLLVLRPTQRAAPAIAAAEPSILDALARILRMVALAALVSALAAFLLLSSRTSFGLGDPVGFILGSGPGAVLAIRVLLALIAFTLAFTWRTGAATRWILLVTAAAGLASLTALSHARESGQAWLLAVDGIHLAAAATWTGLLVGLLLTLTAARRHLLPAQARPVVARAAATVSRAALVTVLVLALTGTLAAIADVGSFPALVATAYGRVLLVKLALFLVTLAFAAVNRQVFVPRLRASGDADAETTTRRFHRLVASEAVVIALILGVTAILSGTAPATAAPLGPGLHLRGHGDHFACTLTIDPGGLGVNTAHLEIAGRNGKPLGDIANVTLFLNEAQGRFPRGTSVLNQTGPTTFDGNVTFGAPGTWYVTVYVQRNTAFDDATDFTIEIARPTP